MIPYGKQDIDSDDIQAVIDCLKSDFLTQGPRIKEFEDRLCDYTQAGFCVSCNSATSALHIALLALDVGEGDIVWTSPVTFVASSNAALYCGASVDFVDIDKDTYNFSYDAFFEKLEQAKLANKLPKVIVPVHLAGQSPEMDRIYELCRSFGIRIIEDASHSIGGSYKGSSIGSCKYSDITIFSFHPVKIVTTGEGGAALTNDSQLFARMNSLRSHGITKSAQDFVNLSHGAWYYEQQSLGYNYRITDIQAALGISQLKKLDRYIKRRHEIVEMYNRLLPEAIIKPSVIEESSPSFHLYIIRLPEELAKFHLDFFNYLRENGVGVNLHYIPVYKQPYYRNLGFKENYCKEAERYYSSAVSIPIYYGLQNDEVIYIVEKINQWISSKE